MCLLLTILLLLCQCTEKEFIIKDSQWVAVPYHFKVSTFNGLYYDREDITTYKAITFKMVDKFYSVESKTGNIIKEIDSKFIRKVNE